MFAPLLQYIEVNIFFLRRTLIVILNYEESSNLFVLVNHSILILALALADTHTAKKNQIFSFLLKKKKKKTLLRHKSSHRHTEAITMKVCEPTTTTTI